MVDESSRAGSVGSVAEETARLLEALFGGESSGPPRHPSPPSTPQRPTSPPWNPPPSTPPSSTPPSPTPPSPTPPSPTPPSPTPPSSTPPELQPDASGEEESEPGTRHTEVCGACGQQVGAAPPGPSPDPTSGVCHLCPVCQLIAAVRSVRPETLERLADLAAAVTQTLREVAATRWAETGQPAAQRHRSTVEDIDVHDGQDDEDRVPDDEDDDEDGDMTGLNDLTGPVADPSAEETRP